MTVTATPTTPATTAPRFTVQISSSDGSPITAVSLIRTANGVTEPVRVQPNPGPSPRTVNDYEAPWGVNVQYTAAITTANGTETTSATPAILDPAVAWLIHPTTPALSCILDSLNTATAGVAALSPVARPATTVAHDIIGAEYRVITKAGVRAASRTQLQITTITSQEQAALQAIIRDQTPLLIRVPAVFLWNWEDGYYDVGQVDIGRLTSYAGNPRRTFTLPLERVEAPAGTALPDRTAADVLAQWASCAAVVAAYATCTDLLTDTRR